MNRIALYSIIFGIAGFCSFISVFWVKSFTLRHNIVDKPSRRKVHIRAIPTLGGFAMWFGFNIANLTAFYLVPSMRNDFFMPLVGISAATFIILIMGIYDDVHDLNAYIKLVIQIAAALILISFGFEINIISDLSGAGKVSLGVLSMFITAAWIVGMINAINLLDGLDGLAAGVSGIAVFFLFISALQVSDIGPAALLCLSLLGAIAGFLPHNFYPAKIFMGNTGSMFLGIIISVISIAGFQKRTAIFTLLVPILIVAVPLIDTFVSILRRLVKRQPVFKADKEHIHHKLMLVEKSQVKTVLSLYFITFCFGLMALGFSKLKGIYALIGLIIIILVTFKWLKNWGILEFK